MQLLPWLLSILLQHLTTLVNPPDLVLFQEFPGALALPYNAIIAPNMEIRYGAMGFDLTAITSMIETLIDEGQVPTAQSSWGSVKALYHNK